MSVFADDHQIRGGDGDAVEVSDNALHVNAKSRFQLAVERGDAYSWATVTYDPAALDTILGVENNDQNRLLYIEKIFFSGDTASQIQVFTVNGITVAGTNAITAVNLNRNSGKVAIATAYDDETGNTEQGTPYTALAMTEVIAASTLKVIEVNGAIALPYDYMVGVDYTTAATGANCTIWGWYE